MAERVHEILQKKWRSRHEGEQRQVLVVKSKCLSKQFYKQADGDQPDCAAEREYQPHRYFCAEQPDSGADQRALGEAEMIVDEEMDVGDVRRQRDLVQENPDQNGNVDD